MKRLTLLLFTLLLLPAVQAQNLIDATQPARIQKLAKEYGNASLAKDAQGNPLIKGRIGTTDYQILFTGCQNDKCSDIQFRAEWKGIPFSAQQANDWNSEERYGTVIFAENRTVVLNMPVILAHGVTEDNLDDTIDWWRVVMMDFQKVLSGEED